MQSKQRVSTVLVVKKLKHSGRYSNQTTKATMLIID